MKKKEIINNLDMLKEIFEKQNDNSKEIALSLIDKAMFLEDVLKRLETEMNKGNVIQNMSQGSYSIKVVNPVLRSYNTTIKNYQTIMKQINELLPKVIYDETNKEDYIEYSKYVEAQTEWIENHKKNNLPIGNDKTIKPYKEWKEEQERIKKMFFDD